MLNLYEGIKDQPKTFTQFNSGEQLLTVYNCPFRDKFIDVLSYHNYIVYVVEGHKTWHGPHGSWPLGKGSCVFIKKGAFKVEQFFDTAFCLVLFFVPDDFIYKTLHKKHNLVPGTSSSHKPVMSIEVTPVVDIFFQSMMAYYQSGQSPDPSLLDLKFQELILTVADNPRNEELLSFFSSLLQAPHRHSLRQVMEDNFLFNLSLDEYAALCDRSLSSFKRDFEKTFASSPGKWLLEKRLEHGKNLLRQDGLSVSEVAYNSGFESPAHFSRAFKSKFGLAPQAARMEKTI
jgi:AraC-like DNA-binding protein